jgi:hypothetical protein
LIKTRQTASVTLCYLSDQRENWFSKKTGLEIKTTTIYITEMRMYKNKVDKKSDQIFVYECDVSII